MPLREIVFDTNVWVSYILKAQLEKLAKIILENDLTVYSSERLISELEDVLSRPEISQHLTLPVEDYVNFHRNLTVITGSIMNSAVVLTPKMITCLTLPFLPGHPIS